MKAIIYCRVSESRTSMDSESCETQEFLCRARCVSNQWEVIGVYNDHGVSGKSYQNRPGLQKAIDEACKKKAILVCYSISRFGRNLRECLHLMDQIRKRKSNLATIKENIDTSNATGEFTFQLFASIAEMERKVIAERTSDAMLTHQAKGRRMSSRPPYGWTIDPDDKTRIKEDPEEQRVLRQVAIWKLAGFSLQQIAGKLDAAGHKYRARPVDGQINMWSRGRVYKVLLRAERSGIYKKPPEKGSPQSATIDERQTSIPTA